MKVTMKSVVLGLVVAFAASSVMGQMATLTSTVSGDGGITAVGGSWAAANSAAPAAAAGAVTFDLTLDSAADILVVDATISNVVGGTIANDTNAAHAATDHNPPIDALKATFPELYTDLWVTTPGGGTTAADASMLAGGETVSHFDTSDDGPQSGFHWASITLVPDSKDGMASADLNATIQTAASPTPLFDDVTVQMTVGVPEPASFGLVMTALLGGLGLVRRKRS